jgi:tetraacyldisaccharide 4'-kinase
MNWERLWYGPSVWWGPLLAPASALYGLVATARAAFTRPVRVEGLYIISIGNLVVGGAGKTPVVIALARHAHARGHKVAVLSRGYGRTARGPVDFDATALPPPEVAGDEPRLIARRCPGVRLFVGADRVASARAALAWGATLAILDDGFQHRRLARDLDLVVHSGLGNGHLLPRGPLRESIAALDRAHLVVLRDEVPSLGRPRELRARTRVLDAPPPGTAVIALCGLARPARFAASLEALGLRVLACHAYPDHHAFSPVELARAEGEARARGATLVLTEKDAERLQHVPPGARVVGLELTLEPAALDAVLSRDA